MGISQHPSLTFAATTRHIISGLRKLAAVSTTAEEATAPLWRAVRGVLPNTFWVQDAAGNICATDMAFMSTSCSKHIPISYMDEHNANVLWALHPMPESDAAYHRGADISMLSQFVHEKEVVSVTPLEPSPCNGACA